MATCLNIASPITDTKCSEQISISFGILEGVVSNIKEDKENFYFLLGDQKQMVTVGSKKPDWIKEGCIVKIDFNEKIIRSVKK